MTVFHNELERIRTFDPVQVAGSVVAVRGMTLHVEDLPIPVGSLVRLDAGEQDRFGEVVGFDSGRTLIMLYGQSTGVRAGDRVIGEHCSPTVNVGAAMLGRTIDALGRPIDGGGAIIGCAAVPIDPDPTGAMARRRITEPIATGVRSIDAMLTIGKGQRMGIFANAGLGKSTLLGSIARNTSADVNIIALIGERGREVRDFIESALGEEGLARSIVVVATSDESPLLRIRAMLVACAAAEHFRDQGADVMLLMDSITRFAQAQRQVGLAVGEPPTTKGYTPSVFSMLPRILERAGSIEGAGSITGIYAVLVEGEEITDPIADAARGVLDGHIVLSQQLAQRGHFPAIDVLASVSRVANDVCDEQHAMARQRLVQLCADYRDVEDLVQIGAYARGSNVSSDLAIEMKPHVDAMLRQGAMERSTFDEAKQAMFAVVEQAGVVEKSMSMGRQAP